LQLEQPLADVLGLRLVRVHDRDKIRHGGLRLH
jgi:hypothetical protein